MDIPLEQSIGSVVKYITERDSESIKVYFNNIPDEFAVPSLYFPIPNVESKKVSLSSYVNRISFEVWDGFNISFFSFLGDSVVKNLHANAGHMVLSLIQDNPKCRGAARPCATTTKSACPKAPALQWEKST